MIKFSDKCRQDILTGKADYIEPKGFNQPGEGLLHFNGMTIEQNVLKFLVNYVAVAVIEIPQPFNPERDTATFTFKDGQMAIKIEGV